MIGLNAFTGGSWAPHFLAHESQLHRVPDAVDDEAAVLVDPLACALHGVLRRPPADDERVLVQGSGIIAMGVVMGLRSLDCRARVTALVRHRDRGELLRSFGADDIVLSPASDSSGARYDRVAAAVGGRRVPAGFGNQALVGGYDLVYDCVGTGSGLTDAVKFARSRGTVVALGTSGISIVDTTPLWFNEVTVMGAYGRQMEDNTTGPARHTYRMILDLMGSGRLGHKGLLTHTFALTDYRQALGTALGRGRGRAVKVAFRHVPCGTGL